MSDLLQTMGKKKDTPVAAAQAEAKGESIVGGESPSDSLKRGDNILNRASGTGTEVEAKTEVVQETPVVETPRTVKNPDDWTRESALTEVVKLREENKIMRLKQQEQLAKINEEKEAAIAKVKEESKSATEAKKKLEAIEADAADKKRSLEEKLAHREARLAETESTYQHKLQEKEAEIARLRSKAEQFEAQQAAQQQIYKDRIKEEMAGIPEEFKQFAERMVKGFDDPSEAWTALSEAKMKGMFGEKKVVVNHSVPGANDGARITNKNAKQAEADAKKAKTSKDLIRSGLAKIKDGTPNSAFRK
jgi:chromosome segregation ATPase